MKKVTTWKRTNLFDPKTIKKSTNISLKNRLRLLLHKKFYSIDWTSEITTISEYKIMGDKIYVLAVHSQIKELK